MYYLRLHERLCLVSQVIQVGVQVPPRTPTCVICATSDATTSTHFRRGQAPRLSRPDSPTARGGRRASEMSRNSLAVSGGGGRSLTGAGAHDVPAGIDPPVHRAA